MPSIGRVGPANAGYYQSAVVAGVEDYYAGDGDAPGVWVGRADLVGAVAGSLATAVDAKLLLEAKCAPDGSRLGKTTVSERSVTAFDLTFSVPKSVSVVQMSELLYVHTAPPTFDPERHGPPEAGTDLSPSGAVSAAVDRQSDQMSATSRRRTLRTLAAESRNQEPDRVVSEPASDVGPAHVVSERVAAARRRLEQLARRQSTRGLER